MKRVAIPLAAAALTVAGAAHAQGADAPRPLGYTRVADALAALQKAPDARITTFGDALWWATATITTVGYGDMYPVTAIGRLVATALMMSGIALMAGVRANHE